MLVFESFFEKFRLCALVLAPAGQAVCTSGTKTKPTFQIVRASFQKSTDHFQRARESPLQNSLAAPSQMMCSRRAEYFLFVSSLEAT